MSDEFDALSIAIPSPTPAATTRATRVARLVCRLYRAATPTLRSRMLMCLLRPLGTLATVGVAAGAFSCFLYREGSSGARAAIGDVARFSNDQVIELARFVEQVSPEALHEMARLMADRSAGLAAFSASVAVLLMQALRQKNPGLPVVLDPARGVRLDAS
ncbi:MAG: hypothetical protein RL375_1498 [Pseudomonadota bacterium]